MRAALLTDQHTNDRGSFAYPLVRALLSILDHPIHVSAGDQYNDAVSRIADRQSHIGCIIVFVRSRVLFRHHGLFRPFSKPVIILDHDACQNSIPGHALFGAWSRFFSANPVSALCVSGRKALQNLNGSIPARVLLVPKAAPQRFLDVRPSRSGRFCIFGSVEPRALYARRASLFDTLHPYTTYDRIVRRFRLYRTSYLLSLLLNNCPDVTRIDFRYRDMERVLPYYSALIVCDQGLGEPMMKHFEASALGLAVFRDDEAEEELAELGYEDGKSMVIYRNIEDLQEKMRWYASHLPALNAIQDRAREVTRNHTWEMRARQLVEFIAREILR